MDKDVRFRISIEGRGGDAIDQMRQSTESLRESLDRVTDSGKAALSGMSPERWVSVVQGVEAVTQTIQGLESICRDLAGAYETQETNERRLEQAMRNTMNATDAQIKSIKDLCSAQQELGVIGDEVQLQGAQELATYLEEVEVLKLLIPVMNDMCAQQYGLEASGESAAQVASMLGKVMNGQVNALSRYGYKFDEAQEEILKTGTEMERAAVLAEVVQQSVGGMNAELAKTDSGKMKQLSNTMGDVQEKIGKIASQAMPFLTMASQATIAAAGMMKLVAGAKAAMVAVHGFNIQGKAMSGIAMLCGVNAKKSAALMRVFSGALTSGARAATAMKYALRGLMSATGVGLAIAALTTLFEAFSNAADKASEKTDEWATELAEFRKEVGDVSAEASRYASAELTNASKLYKAATDESSSRQQRVAAIKELQKKYPEYFSGLDAEKAKISDLKTGYEKLSDAIIKASRARAAEDRLTDNAAKEIELELNKAAAERTKAAAADELTKAQAIYDEIKASEREHGGSFTSMYQHGAGNVDYKGNREVARDNVRSAKSAISSADSTIAAIEDKLNILKEEKEKLSAIIEEGLGLDSLIDTEQDPYSGTGGGGHTSTEAKYTEGASTLKDIEENVRYYQQQLEGCTVETAANINKQIEYWQGLAQAIKDAGKAQEPQEVNPQAATLADVQRNIDILEARKKTATDTALSDINKEIERWREVYDKLNQLGIEKKEPDNSPKLVENAVKLADIEGNIAYYQSELTKATVDEAAAINANIALWQKKADAIREAGKATEDTMSRFRKGFGAVKGLNDGIESVVSTLESHDTAWKKTLAVVDAGLKIYDGVKEVISIVQALTAAKAVENAVTETSTEAKETEAAATGFLITQEQFAAVVSAIAAGTSETEAEADLTAAAAKTFKAHAWMPWVGIGIAAASVAAMIAVMSGLPKFAEGGIAYGPTVGLFGEYAGASRNPEVVAPLDRLRGLLKDDRSMPAEVRLVAHGRDLIGVLNTTERRLSR